MPDFRMDCDAHTPGGTHTHTCYLAKGHAGMHACYCGLDWEEDGRVKLRESQRRR
jgi:hypothetical protein